MENYYKNTSHMPISSSSSEMTANNLSKSKADLEEFTPEKVRKVEESNNKYLKQCGIVLNIIYKWELAMNLSWGARKIA